MNSRLAQQLVLVVMLGVPAIGLAQEFTNGAIPPHQLLRITSSITRTQTFAADGKGIEALQLLLSSGAGQLVVEVRSRDLRRLLGSGVVESSPAFGWKTVSWQSRPALTIDAEYALVLRTASVGQWAIAVSEVDVYPWGTGPAFEYRPRAVGWPQRDGGVAISSPSSNRVVSGIDIGFRIRFDNAAMIDSPLAVSRTPPNTAQIPHAPHGLPRIDETGPPLPLCVNGLCADPSANLIGNDTQRQSRAIQNFEPCSPDIARMSSPTGGLTCSDVCEGLQLKACRRMVANDVSSCAYHAYSEVHTCDAIIGSQSKPRVGCVCGDIPDLERAERWQRRQTGFWSAGWGDRVIHEDVESLTTVDLAGGVVTRSEVAGEHEHLEQMGEWMLLRTVAARGHPGVAGSRKMLAIGPSGATREIDVDECEYAYWVRFQARPWVACYLDNELRLVSGETGKVLATPTTPEDVRRGPVAGVGEGLYFMGQFFRWWWKPGDGSWTKLGAAVSIEHPQPSVLLGKILTEIHGRDPSFPGFVGTRFYDDGGWMFDVRAGAFYHSDLPDRGDFEASDAVVRYGNYLLDDASGEFRLANVPATATWAGRRAVLPATDCPRGVTCKPLPAPFRTYVTAEFDPAELSSVGAIQMEPLEVD